MELSDLETRRRRVGLSIGTIAALIQRPYARTWGLLHGGFDHVQQSEIDAIEEVISEAEAKANGESDISGRRASA